MNALIEGTSAAPKEKWRAILVHGALCGLLLIIVRLALHPVLAPQGARIHLLISSIPLILIVGIASIVHSLVRESWGYHVQTAALSASVALITFLAPVPIAQSGLWVGVWLLSGVLAWKLPIEHRLLRRVLIVVCTLGLLALFRHVHRMHGWILLQFIYTCEVMATKPKRSWVDCHRAMCSLHSNMPPEQLVAQTHSAKSRWSGWIFFGAGMLLLVVGGPLLPMLRGGRVPPTSLIEHAHHPVSALGWGLFAVLTFLLFHIGRHVSATGLCRILGVPVETPVGNLFKVTNIIEFWSTTNRWRWKMLRVVYVDNFLPLRRDLLGVFSILGLFIISGIHHTPQLKASGLLPWAFLGCWTLQGALAAATYHWIMYRLKRRMRTIATKGYTKAAPPSAAKRVTTVLIAAACFVLVILTQGVLMLLKSAS